MITWEITAMPLYGTAAFNGDNLTYTPDLDYIGSDFIIYRQVIDGVPQIERRICLEII